MASAVIMPRQGISVESCIITKWHIKQGDTVKVGDLLLTYETDKATFDLESELEGTVLAILWQEGDDVPVLENILVIGKPGEDISQFTTTAAAETPEEKPVQSAEQVIAEAPVLRETPAEGRLNISPRARNTAQVTGVDYTRAAGTGPDGRIIERDIFALREAGVFISPAAASAAGQDIQGTGIGGRVLAEDIAGITAATAPAPVEAPKAAFTDVPMTNIRKVISKAMHASLANTAQLTLHSSFDATAIMNYRKSIKASAEALGLGNITLNDIILYAVSRVLPNHKALNAHLLNGDTLRFFESVNLGLAVDTERGLMVPTIFDAQKLSLSQISATAKDLAAQCQKGTINPDYIKGGTFTVTNLGTLGIEVFTPVLNAPQTGILGVNTIVERVKTVGGQLISYPAMGLSLTFDHRAVDGAPAARFLKDVATALENFSALLAK